MSRREPPGPAAAPSPHLVRSCEALARSGGRPTTLKALRAALQREAVHWSSEGELLTPQDRTALIIELDELIDAHGPDAELAALAAARPGAGRGD